MSRIAEDGLGLVGLSGRIRPIISSEVVKYFILGAKYDSSKAHKVLGLEDKPFKETLRSAVHWYVRNGYIRRGSKVL
ncbi:hypothetical protein OMAG_002678 [Candidatus Omnitrophus magneticus]|uniref:Uncharacterized protein n=1 Tax=Candidatus Omnitrophus magneticus TaxID=1609969 RepID=A0A0F0CJP5_9BACT|nr:hypothetical protein OMAG_002678 [Candidatus Omnitrophus magneticus]